MKTHHICPKCGGHRILLVPDVVRGSVVDPLTNEPKERFEAYVCEHCQFTEFYSSEVIVADGDRIRLLASEESDIYDEWSAEKEHETGDFYDGDWPLEEFDNTEVSRVEKKPDLPFGSKVVLVHIGPRPSAVISVLRENLGFTIESEDKLRESLPFVVMDLITGDAARGLKKLLEDAGAVVELQSRTDD